jgi:phenylacetate-CoA ligase
MNPSPTAHHAPSHPVSSWLVRRVIYPLWVRRDHPRYSAYAQQFEKNQLFSPEELERWQAAALRDQLLHAFRNVPFYRRRFEVAGVTPLDIRSADDLKALPVLTKTDVQNHNVQLLARNVPESNRIRNQTGGSTGSPLQFWVDCERMDSRRASTDRHNAWAGLRPGDWYAHLWGSRFDTGTVTTPTINWRQRFLYRNLTLNTSLISDEDLTQYVALLRRVRPCFMVAYAQSAVFFARYCESRGIDDIRFRSLIVTAEMLLPGQRALLEKVFHAKVFNRYGSREVSVIASDCPHFTGMHVNADALIVEVEPAAGLPLGTGRVLVTDLLNRSMPLIRYEIGDLASPLETSVCPCGRAFPRIADIRGRITDFLVTADNRRISGISLALLAGDMPQVRQMQFVQNDRRNIQLRVVAGEGYGVDTITELRRRLDPYLRGTTELSIVTVERILPEPSGKFRYVKTAAELNEHLAESRSA